MTTPPTDDVLDQALRDFYGAESLPRDTKLTLLANTPAKRRPATDWRLWLGLGLGSVAASLAAAGVIGFGVLWANRDIGPPPGQGTATPPSAPSAAPVPKGQAPLPPGTPHLATTDKGTGSEDPDAEQDEAPKVHVYRPSRELGYLDDEPRFRVERPTAPDAGSEAPVDPPELPHVEATVVDDPLNLDLADDSHDAVSELVECWAVDRVIPFEAGGTWVELGWLVADGRAANLRPYDGTTSGETATCVRDHVSKWTFTGVDGPTRWRFTLAFPEEVPISAEELVRDTVSEHAGQLSYCYEKALRRDPSLEGRVELTWVLRAGVVHDAVVTANSSGNVELADCVQDKLESWVFPDRLDGEYGWPFVFRLPAE